MHEVEIYHAKFGHSGMKNEKVMTVLVIYGKAGGRGVNRVKGEIQGGN